ncbi:GntR family transcriptional regulator [Micromonospora sp. CPCC 205371]|nr:GntR family transcriptional regulator [Micromonospora sp. CPCC 205371]
MDLHIRLDGRGTLTGQIYQQIRDGVLSGRLRAGEALPPTRVLAARSDFNPVRPAGSPPLPAGSLICEYGVRWQVYDSRWHAFVVGTNSSNSIYHTWQGSGGGSYGPWVSLGGTGRSGVSTLPYNNSSGGLALEIAVVGLSGVRYCKNYNGNVGGGWWPGQTSWTSNGASCRLF